MVRLMGDIPPKAKNFIKFEIERNMGRSNKIWKLQEKSEDENGKTEFTLTSKTRDQKAVRTVVISVNSKFC